MVSGIDTAAIIGGVLARLEALLPDLIDDFVASTPIARDGSTQQHGRGRSWSR